MTRKINYEDDIFALSMMVRYLQDIVKLEIDPGYFQKKVVADIGFIDAAAERIRESLIGSPFFLKKQEYLTSLLRLERDFAGMLEEVSAKKGAFAALLSSALAGLEEMRESHARSVGEIRSALSRTGDAKDEEHIISEDEFKILLSPEGEEEG